MAKHMFSSGQFFVTFLGWLSDPFQWLSDLQLGDEKVTLTHLDLSFFLLVSPETAPWMSQGSWACNFSKSHLPKSRIR